MAGWNACICPAFFEGLKDNRKMSKAADFTQGKILGPLFRFALPVLFAMFLQALYGAVDLFVVGWFAESADVSAVSTGSQLMFTITGIIVSLSMGVTVFMGQKLGEGRKDMGGRIIGGSIWLFFFIGIAFTAVLTLSSEKLSAIMQAPPEAFAQTKDYIFFCGAGSVVIVAYNLLAAIFRGIGDARTPLITVIIACAANIGGDLLFIAVFHMGARGAALATVLAQFISVILSLIIIKKQGLPFPFRRKDIRTDREVIRNVLPLGTPSALQDLMVGISFLIIMAVVNSLGLEYSAGIGVAEKVCSFIMLIPSAFMNAMSAFVAQNKGAGKYDRALTTLRYAIITSSLIGVVMFFFAFFHGDLLAGIFSKDSAVVMLGADYLKAYGIDCLLTCFLFCFIGYYNGMGATRFVMVQGISAAFLIRVPVAVFMSRWEPVSLFHIGLSIPCSTVYQILLCFVFLHMLRKKLKF